MRNCARLRWAEMQERMQGSEWTKGNWAKTWDKLARLLKDEVRFCQMVIVCHGSKWKRLELIIIIVSRVYLTPWLKAFPSILHLSLPGVSVLQAASPPQSPLHLGLSLTCFLLQFFGCRSVAPVVNLLHVRLTKIINVHPSYLYITLHFTVPKAI